LILFCIIPSTAFIEKDIAPTLTSVVTSIEIDAPPNVVWKNVIEFPQLKEPTDFIFKTGIAYPINAKIVGKGVGSVWQQQMSIYLINFENGLKKG
jgi:hypothetical protein